MNNPLTRERRDALRGIAADDRHAMTVLAADMLALLDAADERDELQARLDLAGGAPRTVPGVMEHGDTPCLIGASHPASDPCEYACPATMPGHRCTRLEHAEGGHLWATTEEEWARLLAELAEADSARGGDV